MVINATNIAFGKGFQTETYHFTGGLCAHPQDNGLLMLGPTRIHDNELIGQFLPWPEVLSRTKACGCEFVGVNQSFHDGGAAPQEFWRPAVQAAEGKFHAADLWGALSYNANLNKDQKFSDVARFLSVSISAAGVRLRDVARAHHNQLQWALLDGREPTHRYSNLAMTDLYLAFHSLASELCSARDHLARIAAMGCGLKESIESLSRLEGWVIDTLKKGGTVTHLIALLMTALGPKESPGWLRTMGDVRNAMMHRQPMAANPEAAYLCLMKTDTDIGPIHTIRLVSHQSSEGADPFGQLLAFYNAFERLAITASGSEYVPYKAELPHIVAN